LLLLSSMLNAFYYLSLSDESLKKSLSLGWEEKQYKCAGETTQKIVQIFFKSHVCI